MAANWSYVDVLTSVYAVCSSWILPGDAFH